jgi:hypothetical protein
MDFGSATMSKILHRMVLVILALGAASVDAGAQNRPTQFWNLTANTVTEFYLAPAGTTNWGPNQCKNDKDGAVDPDERLRITDLPSGTYDAKLTDVSRRTCIVHNINIEKGKIFSVDEKDLTSCVH